MLRPRMLHRWNVQSGLFPSLGPSIPRDLPSRDVSDAGDVHISPTFTYICENGPPSGEAGPMLFNRLCLSHALPLTGSADGGPSSAPSLPCRSSHPHRPPLSWVSFATSNGYAAAADTRRPNHDLHERVSPRPHQGIRRAPIRPLPAREALPRVHRPPPFLKWPRAGIGRPDPPQWPEPAQRVIGSIRLTPGRTAPPGSCQLPIGASTGRWPFAGRQAL